MNVKKTLLWKICRKVYAACKFFVFMFTRYDRIEKEHIKRFGKDFPDKTFYVIRRVEPGAGLLSNFHWVLGHTIYAISKGYIPIVNMENYKTYYKENSLIETGSGKTLNAWEYYFEPLDGYSLADIKKAKNVVLSELSNPRIDELPCVFPSSSLEAGNENVVSVDTISRYYELVSQYCKFNAKTTSHIESQKKSFFGNKENILGVLHRGTDYKAAKDHDTPPTIEQTLQKARQVFQEERFSYIFLCTEEQEAVDEFCKAFEREKVIISDAQRIKEYDSGMVPDIIHQNSLSVYKTGLDYLTDMYLLSQCGGIITPRVNGAIFAIGYNNNKYRYSYVFNLGVNR